MAENHDSTVRKSKMMVPVKVFFKDWRRVFKWDEIGREILGIAFPASLAVAADPIASLIDTAFVGHIGPIELAAVGVAIAIFNQASRITIFPLVSITTSFVAEEDTIGKPIAEKASKSKNLEKGSSQKIKTTQIIQKNQDHEHENTREKDSEKIKIDDNMDEDEPDSSYFSKLDSEKGKNEKTGKNPERDSAQSNEGEESTHIPEDHDHTFEVAEKDLPAEKTKTMKGKNKEKRHIASATTALIFGSILGLFQAIFLIFGSTFLLSLMGVKHNSPMLNPARKYLVLRSLGAPAVLLSLAMQGIFRGFKDTKTPLYVIVFGYTINIILDPILIFVRRRGVAGAAIAHVISQYLIVLILLWKLMQKVYLLPPNLKDLQFGRFLKNGGLLLARVVAVTFCVTLAASMAARLGPTPMAAFQTCLQVWMTSSLLADGLAVAGQAILACAFAEKDYDKATSTATRALQMSLVLGVALSILVGIGLYFGAGVFSRDLNVQHLIRIGLPFVAATQPLNSLAFVFDGVNFGASDFAYSAYSLVLVSGVSIACLFLLSKSHGFVGIWTALAIYMALRTIVGVWRMGTGTGPWRYLRVPLLP